MMGVLFTVNYHQNRLLGVEIGASGRSSSVGGHSMSNHCFIRLHSGASCGSAHSSEPRTGALKQCVPVSGHLGRVCRGCLVCRHPGTAKSRRVRCLFIARGRGARAGTTLSLTRIGGVFQRVSRIINFEIRPRTTHRA